MKGRRGRSRKGLRGSSKTPGQDGRGPPRGQGPQPELGSRGAPVLYEKLWVSWNGLVVIGKRMELLGRNAQKPRPGDPKPGVDYWGLEAEERQGLSQDRWNGKPVRRAASALQAGLGMVSSEEKWQRPEEARPGAGAEESPGTVGGGRKGSKTKERLRFAEETVELRGENLRSQVFTIRQIEETLSGEEQLNGETLDLSGERLDLPQDQPRLSGEKLRLSGERLRLSGEKLRLSGERLRLSGERLRLSGERLRPSGERLRPSGERLRLSEDKLRLSGEKLRLSGERPSGESLRLSGEKLRLSGERPRLSGEKPSGETLRLSGEKLTLSQDKLQPSGEKLSGENLGLNGERLSLLSEDKLRPSGEKPSRESLRLSEERLTLSEDKLRPSGEKLSGEKLSSSQDKLQLRGEQLETSGEKPTAGEEGPHPPGERRHSGERRGSRVIRRERRGSVVEKMIKGERRGSRVEKLAFRGERRLSKEEKMGGSEEKGRLRIASIHEESIESEVDVVADEHLLETNDAEVEIVSERVEGMDEPEVMADGVKAEEEGVEVKEEEAGDEGVGDEGVGAEEGMLPGEKDITDELASMEEREVVDKEPDD